MTDHQPSQHAWKGMHNVPEGVVVWTKIHDAHGERNVQKLIFRDRFWRDPRSGVYVYYTPTHWAPEG